MLNLITALAGCPLGFFTGIREYPYENRTWNTDAVCTYLPTGSFKFIIKEPNEIVRHHQPFTCNVNICYIERRKVIEDGVSEACPETAGPVPDPLREELSVPVQQRRGPRLLRWPVHAGSAGAEAYATT